MWCYLASLLGKTLDTTCPLGPCITHGSDIDPQNLGISTWVNNQLRQKSNTNNMIFDIREIVHQLSMGFTLYPGTCTRLNCLCGV